MGGSVKKVLKRVYIESMRNFRMKTLWITLTLFSMFFGAGNLIFAPFLGKEAGSQSALALLGFLCTAVLMPIVTILVLSKFKDGYSMLSRISKPFALFFIGLISLLIGPCIAIPRTATTSYEMLGWLLPANIWSQLLYSAIFFMGAYFVALHPSHLKDVLGKWLSPILLVLVIVLCGAALFSPSQIASPSLEYLNHSFAKGIKEGYQTMDILAAYCFGNVILLNIQSEGIVKKQEVRKTLLFASIGAGVLLAGLYSLLAMSGMLHSYDLRACTNGAQILTEIAGRSFGLLGNVLVSLIFLIACFNVCSGLLSCVSSYFAQRIPSCSYRAWLILFTLFSAALSVFGLDSILAISAPILNVLCPIAIFFVLYGIVQKP